ncbi:MAG: hypothetical protein WC761_01925 [Candidatus Paceibacterota bacterium]|jgi:hypothetical protein
MKIKTYKTRVNKMLNWYAERITLDLLGFADIRTFAGMEYARRALVQAQYEKMKEEPQTVEWKFPVEAWVHFEDAVASIRVKVNPDWEIANLLYLDFDSK